MRFFILAAVFLGLAGCRSKQAGTTAKMGFYYWRTDYAPNANEKKLLRQTKSGRLYVRFFDLDTRWSDNDEYDLEPVARLQNKEKFEPGIEVVPVIYITRDALEHLKTKEACEKYVTLSVAKINRMARRNGATEIKEYQLDCDWTATTRDTYFAFLKQFKVAVEPTIVSVTLRLHQYKYRKKSGIPPADRVMLMYYNMGELSTFSPENYVLNNKIGRQYLNVKEKYPLPIDFALPLYYQGRKYDSENNEFIDFVDGEKLASVEHAFWLKKTSKTTYKVKPKRVQVANYNEQEAYVWSPSEQQGFYEGDLLVSDKFSFADLIEAGKLLKQCVNTDQYNVVFYHLDDVYTKEYKAYELEAIKATVN